MELQTHYYDRSVGETPENAPYCDVNALDVTAMAHEKRRIHSHGNTSRYAYP